VDKAAADAENNLAALKQAEANVLVAKEALKTAQVAEAGLEAQSNCDPAATYCPTRGFTSPS
jgi:hypothetical protein